MYNRMRTFPRAEADQIYAHKYKTASRFDDLEDGVDMCILDVDINSGVGRGPRVLSKLLGQPATSKMTDALVQEANRRDPIALIDALCDERLIFMKSIRGGSDWARFGGGWSRRVADVRTTSKLLVTQSHSSAPTIPAGHGKGGKATHKDPHGVIIKKVGTGTAGGVAGGSATHLVHGSALVTGAIIVGVIVIGGYVYYKIRTSQQAAQDHVELPPGLVIPHRTQLSLQPTPTVTTTVASAAGTSQVGGKSS
jgi:lysozyme family protein